MTLVEELERWKTDLEELNLERAKAESRLEQAMESLKSLGYDSVEDASKALDALKTKKEAAELEAREMLDRFKEKYAEFIEQEEG
jgi:Holliday junction resolvasome RuvABC DNA-binding subunit